MVYVSSPSEVSDEIHVIRLEDGSEHTRYSYPSYELAALLEQQGYNARGYSCAYGNRNDLEGELQNQLRSTAGHRRSYDGYILTDVAINALSRVGLELAERRENDPFVFGGAPVSSSYGATTEQSTIVLQSRSSGSSDASRFAPSAGAASDTAEVVADDDEGDDFLGEVETLEHSGTSDIEEYTPLERGPVPDNEAQRLAREGRNQEQQATNAAEGSEPGSNEFQDVVCTSCPATDNQLAEERRSEERMQRELAEAAARVEEFEANAKAHRERIAAEYARTQREHEASLRQHAEEVARHERARARHEAEVERVRREQEEYRRKMEEYRREHGGD